MPRLWPVCCMLALPAPVLSQDAPLFADRPDFTESATITSRGRIQFEGGWAGQGGDGGVSAHTFGGVVRGGIAERVETWIEVTWFAIDDARGAEISGRGDADAGFKVLLLDQAPPQVPAATLLVSSSVPVGDDGIGERGWQPEARLLLGWQLSPAWSLGVNGGGGLPLAGGERFGQALASVSLGRSLGSGLGLVAEVHGVSPADPGRRHTAYANGGLTVPLDSDAWLDLRVGAGLTKASADWLVGLEFMRGWRKP